MVVCLEVPLSLDQEEYCRGDFRGYWRVSDFEDDCDLEGYSPVEAKEKVRRLIAWLPLLAKSKFRYAISLNPDYFAGRSEQGILSTLVHEMVHLWQNVCAGAFSWRAS
jgi:hypothetical protein